MLGAPADVRAPRVLVRRANDDRHDRHGTGHERDHDAQDDQHPVQRRDRRRATRAAAAAHLANPWEVELAVQRQLRLGRRRRHAALGARELGDSRDWLGRWCSFTRFTIGEGSATVEMVSGSGGCAAMSARLAGDRDRGD